jgi:hypothetical protein
MVQIHVVEKEEGVFFQPVDIVPNPAAHALGKVQKNFKGVVDVEIFFFVGQGFLVFDAEETRALPVFVVRTIQAALLLRPCPEQPCCILPWGGFSLKFSGGPSQNRVFGKARANPNICTIFFSIP